MLRYSVLRLLIFFGVLGLLWLLGLRDPEERIILVVGAAVLSMVISFFVLRRFREDYSREIAQKLERRAAEKQRKRAAAASDEAAEDHEARGGEEYR